VVRDRNAKAGLHSLLSLQPCPPLTTNGLAIRMPALQAAAGRGRLVNCKEGFEGGGRLEPGQQQQMCRRGEE